MRGLRIYVALAISLLAWPCFASPLGKPGGPGLAVPAAGRCEAAATSTLPLRDEGTTNRMGEGADSALGAEVRPASGRATRWAAAPELVVLMSVMEYQAGARSEYQATSDRLTSEEVSDLVADLSGALALLTGNVYTEFAAVHRESTPAGATASVMRPGQIVVGRYRGVRDQLNTIGVGGRFRRGGVITGGTVVLDNDYDRASTRRWLLRTHELGHALGYDHVDESHPSIMNPRIGSEPTEFDRRAALVAFQAPALLSPAPCVEP